MKYTVRHITIAAFLTAATVTMHTACAQEGSPSKANKAVPTTPASPPASHAAQPCVEADVRAILDVTGSFVDVLQHDEFWSGVKKRIQQQFPKLCAHAEVSVGILGHSHANVTGTLDHLLGKTYVVTRNGYSADNMAQVLLKRLDSLRDDLRSGKIPKQMNTSVAGAFDRMADQQAVRDYRPSIIFVISDVDESELTGAFPTPRDKGNLRNSQIYVLGAGITLAEGTQARRTLRSNWMQFMKTADAAKFIWIDKP